MDTKCRFSEKKLVISIVGLTASGKTSFLHSLIDILKLPHNSFVVISVDSGAIYKNLDIGTAKPSSQELHKYNYRLVNVVSPCERYSLAKFIDDAKKVITREDYQIIFIVGGTPLYFYTLMGESAYVPVKPDYVLREYLAQLADKKGNHYLHFLLSQIDPVSASKIHSNDRKRLIRTLEIVLSLGKMRIYASKYVKVFNSFVERRYIFLPDPNILRKNISIRTKQMLEGGWEREVSMLLKTCPPPAPWLDVLGYKTVYRLVSRDISYDYAIELLLRDTWKFARRQRTWFKKDKKGRIVAREEDIKSARNEIIKVIELYRASRGF